MIMKSDLFFFQILFSIHTAVADRDTVTTSGAFLGPELYKVISKVGKQRVVVVEYVDLKMLGSSWFINAFIKDVFDSRNTRQQRKTGDVFKA